jgi:uncharacterized membrane protein
MSHLVAGIAWIGSSFYFIWLDSSFEAPETERRNVEGELFMVHGGFYYRVEKRKIWPQELPKTLHWFKWEATLTVLTGYFLLIWLYFMKGASLLLKPGSELSQTMAIALSLGLIAAAWFIYDSLWKYSNQRWLNILLTSSLIVGFVFLTLQLFSARGAYILTGAMLGTTMLLNVWVRILPGQKKMVVDAENGKIPDTSFSVKAKTRSVHNTYFTFPVLLIMLSNHYPGIYNHPLSGLLLLGLGISGALIRHAMVTKNKSERWVLAPAALILLATILFHSRGTGSAQSNLAPNEVSWSQVAVIMEKRCLSCHGSQPTDEIFREPPKGIIIETEAQALSLKNQILQQVVIGQTMPLGNKTQITEEERQIIAKWVQQNSN